MNDKDIRAKMDKAVIILEENLRKLRTGRANVSILENIRVDVYGTTMPINQIATISAQDFKTLVVQPWDKSNIDPIIKTISTLNLGLTPVEDSGIVRIHVPELTEERRKELIKVVGAYEEEAKVSLRQIRKEVIEEMKKDTEATEDDVRLITQKSDTLIKEYNEKVSQMCEKKRDEMMQV